MANESDYVLPAAHAGSAAQRTVYTLTWQTDDGTAVNLTGATVTGRIQPIGGSSRAITGTITVTTAASGIFTWEPSSADLGTAASANHVQFYATASGKVDSTYLHYWPVLASIPAP